MGGLGAARRAVGRTTTASLAAMWAGGAHLALAGEHLHGHGAHWIGVGFIVSGAALLLGGLAIGRSPTSRLGWALAGAVSLLTADAYVFSRTIGLPGHPVEPWDFIGIVTTAAELFVFAAAFVVLGPKPSRRVLVPLLVGSLLVPTVAQAYLLPGDAPRRCVAPTRSLTLYAEELQPGPDGKPRLAFGTSPNNASIPGPLIELVEGDCLFVTLVNHVSADTLRAIRDDGRWPSDLSLPLGISLHPHGVRYTPVSDGTVHTGSFVPPGQAKTYIWYAAPRAAAGGHVASPGSAGYWWYHDHVVGTDHGTGGLASGLFGGLIVRRADDTLPDRTYTVAMGGPSPMINMRTYPATFNCDNNNNRPGPDCFVAYQGERVEFLVIGLPGTLAREDMHVFHLHGHTWADNRTGLLAGNDDDTRVIDAKSVGPSESFGFQVTAGEDVGWGDWMLHCHIQEHSDRGMVTFFRVLVPADTTGYNPVHVGPMPHMTVPAVP